MKQAVKSLLNQLADRTGYELRKKESRLQSEARFGIDILGYLIDDLASRRGVENIFLFQAGANDGLSEDEVCPILRKHKIQSVLCEPLPDAFANLQNTYAGCDHAKLAQCAVGSSDGELKLYRISQQFRPSESTKIASFDRQHVEHFLRVWDLPDEALTTEIVPCKTVSTILTDAQAKQIDIAVLDTEGMDDLICQQLLNLDTPPSVLKFEYVNSPIENIKMLMQQLTNLEYRFVRGGYDITATRAHEN